MKTIRDRGKWLHHAAAVMMLSGLVARAEERQREKLGRGVVAVPRPEGGVLVSWRLLADDAKGIGFHVSRRTEGGMAVKLTEELLAGATCYVDVAAEGEDTRWKGTAHLYDSNPRDSAARDVDA